MFRPPFKAKMSGEFPNIQSTHSLVAKHVTKDKWDQLKDIETKTCGFTLAKAIACAVEFDNQHCGIYAGDWDSYKDFAIVFDPLIQEYHGISPDARHTSDMDATKVVGNISAEVPVHSTRIRVGRNIDGFGLSPGITKDQRIAIEKLMASALSKLTGDLAGTYYPLTGMDEGVRQKLVDDHFLFMSGDRNLAVSISFLQQRSSKVKCCIYFCDSSYTLALVAPRLPVWSGTGLRAAASSTTSPRPSCCG